MPVRPHRLPPEDAPLAFSSQAPDAWEGWMVELEAAAKANRMPPPPAGIPSRVGDATRLLDRWLVLVERAPVHTPVDWWRQALAHAGHWCPAAHPWPGDRIVQDGRSGYARFLAAWIAQAPQSSVSAHWPRQPWDGVPGTVSDDKSAWSDQLLERLEQSLIQDVQSGPALLRVLGPWVEAAGALQARLDEWGVENTLWSVRRYQDQQAVGVFAPDVQNSVDPELWQAWAHPLVDRALYRTAGPLTKKTWCGTVEVLVRLGARLVPFLKAGEDGAGRVDAWWESVHRALRERAGRAAEFPNPDTAWADWESVKVANWKERSAGWRLALKLEATLGGAPAKPAPGGRKHRL